MIKMVSWPTVLGMRTMCSLSGPPRCGHMDSVTIETEPWKTDEKMWVRIEVGRLAVYRFRVVSCRQLDAWEIRLKCSRCVGEDPAQ